MPPCFPTAAPFACCCRANYDTSYMCRVREGESCVEHKSVAVPTSHRVFRPSTQVLLSESERANVVRASEVFELFSTRAESDTPGSSLVVMHPAVASTSPLSVLLRVLLPSIEQRANHRGYRWRLPSGLRRISPSITVVLPAESSGLRLFGLPSSILRYLRVVHPRLPFLRQLSSFERYWEQRETLYGPRATTVSAFPRTGADEGIIGYLRYRYLDFRGLVRTRVSSGIFDIVTSILPICLQASFELSVASVLRRRLRNNACISLRWQSCPTTRRLLIIYVLSDKTRVIQRFCNCLRASV